MGDRKALGYVLRNPEHDTHMYACQYCLDAGLTDPGATDVRQLTPDDRRQEAYWCDECDDLLLASRGNEED